MKANKKVTPEIFGEMWDFHCRYPKSKSKRALSHVWSRRSGMGLSFRRHCSLWLLRL